jgi:hypothetical protein
LDFEQFITLKEELNMIITDYNEMSLTKLYAINSALGIEFEINDGVIMSATREESENE